MNTKNESDSNSKPNPIDSNPLLLESNGPGPSSFGVVFLMEFKNRRCAGEAITAKQFIAQRLVPDDPKIIVDLAFADFLESEKGGESDACNRLCEQFPEHAKEIRRQVQFHRAVTCPTGATVREEATGTSEAVYPLSIPGLDLIRPLGRGGMGIVYLAHQPKLNRKVAVKLLLDGVFATAMHRARFRAEAQAAAALRHPNIVQIDEVGEANGQPYLVMEYVDGGTLEEFLKKHLRVSFCKAPIIK